MKRQKGSSCSILSPESPDYAGAAARVIRAGGVAAIPTETCFGLAVDPFNPLALERLFSIKRRVHSKPVLVLIDTRSCLEKLVSSIPPPYEALMQTHWPGPLTLVFPALAHLPLLVTGGNGTVGIRMSSNDIATEICRLAGGAITATSANISGQKPAYSVAEVIDSIGREIDLVVASEIDPGSDCSTIVKEKNGELVLIRAGRISFADLLV